MSATQGVTRSIFHSDLGCGEGLPSRFPHLRSPLPLLEQPSTGWQEILKEKGTRCPVHPPLLPQRALGAVFPQVCSERRGRRR